MPICVNNARECDGCMMCQERLKPVGYCYATGDVIYAGDEYFRIDGEIYSEGYIDNCRMEAGTEDL